MSFIQKLKSSKILRPYFSLRKKSTICYKKILSPLIIKDYFKKNNVRKIHLGCGGRIFSGWLNTDVNIYADCYLDLKNKLPFPDQSVDFIYSEHVLEHLEYLEAKNLLKECYRVLKPNGVIRTALPDLDFFIQGLKDEGNKKYQDFIRQKRLTYEKLANLPANINTMLNFIFFYCGHKYVYQDKTFIALLASLGFKNIKKAAVGQSDFFELNNLETDPRKRPLDDLQFWLMQTMSLEARK